jgi:hypothetical protein
MQILSSIMAIVLGWSVVKKTIKGACAQKEKKISVNGVDVYCSVDDERLVRDALNDVTAFFGDQWPSRQKHIKTVVINEGIMTSLWIPQRTVLILKSDPSRMKSVRNMAGWLIADYERIDVLQKHSCRLIHWSKKAMGLSSIDALLQRLDYMEGRGYSPIAETSASAPTTLP